MQRLKNSFVYNLWSWNMMYLGEDAYSLLAFLEWLASSRGLALFSVVPSFFLCSGVA